MVNIDTKETTAKNCLKNLIRKKQMQQSHFVT